MRDPRAPAARNLRVFEQVKRSETFGCHLDRRTLDTIRMAAPFRSVSHTLFAPLKP